MSTHILKVWPPYFRALRDGRKTFEVRREDRGFDVGDLLVLREWEPHGGTLTATPGFTGSYMHARVTYVLRGDGVSGVQPGFVVLGLAIDLEPTMKERR